MGKVRIGSKSNLPLLGGMDQLPLESRIPFETIFSEGGGSMFGTKVDMEGNFWGAGGGGLVVGASASHGR